MSQVWFNGYDRGTLQQYWSLMHGRVLRSCSTSPSRRRGLPGVYPALQTYIKEMKKYQPKFTYNETALDGWIAADQFVTGTQGGGKGNLDAKRLVVGHQHGDSLHRRRAHPPVNWTTGHTSAAPPYCQAAVQVVQRQLRPGLRSRGRQRSSRA